MGKDQLFGLNDYLTEEQMQTNATYIYGYLSERGWSKEEVAAILGNMQAESTISHGRWQSGKEGNMVGGFGLVQWTPARGFFDWAKEKNLDAYDIDTQLHRILLEVEGEIYQWQLFRTEHDMTFKEFTQSMLSSEELAVIFLLDYERPADKSQAIKELRSKNAKYWYEYLK